MPSGYHHLTHGERCRTCALRKSGLSDLAIARQIGRDRTTVRREIRRNGGGRGYRHGQAQCKASARRSAASSVARKMTRERWRTAGGQAGGGLEPGADRRPLPQGGHPDGGPGDGSMPARPRRPEGRGAALPVPAPPGQEAELEGRAPLGPGPHPGLHGHLRAPGDRGGEGAGRRLGGGHDRRQGPQRRAGVRWRDRASNCTLLQRVGRRTAAAVGAALLELLLPLTALVHTITADNGKEFAGHAWVARALGAGFLFATPCHSWERGLNEHANGLVRGYFPKDTDFQQITDAEARRSRTG